MESGAVKSKRSEWVLLLLLCGGVLFSRIPAIRFGHELNLDESLMLAQASRFAKDIVPWRSVDGLTSGPVNSWALLVAHWFGMPLAYSPAHLFAALLLAGTVPLLYHAAKSRYGALPASVAVTCEAIWIILNQKTDFIHYSSELASIFLISASLALGERQWRGIFSAFLLGIVPWAKLQAAPIAVIVGIWMLSRVFWDSDRQKGRVAHTVLMLLAGLTFSVIILIMVLAGGAGGEMWNSYFVVTRYYSSSFGLWTLLRRLALFYGSGTGCAWFAVLLILRLFLGKRAVSSGFWDSLFRWLLAFVSAYACVRTGLPYDHYQLLMLPALVLLTAATFVEWSGVEPNDTTRLRIATVALLVFATLHLHEAYYRFRAHIDYPSPEESQQVSNAILRDAPSARSLTVWGWFPSLFVETGIPPSTRHAVYHFLILDTPSRDFLRKGFMEDFLRSGSEVFVEGGPIPLSSFPDLDAYVHDRFRLSQRMDTASGPVSIYTRAPAKAPTN